MRRSSASDAARLGQNEALDESSVASTSYLAPSSTASMLVDDRALPSSHLQSASMSSRKGNGKGKARAQDDDEEDEAELAQGLAGSLLQHGQAPGSSSGQAASWELRSGTTSSSAYSVRSPPPAAAMASTTASAAARRRRRRRSAETGSPTSRAGMTTTAAAATTLLLLPCLAGLAAAASVALGSGAGGLGHGYRLGQAERGAAVQGLGRSPPAPSQAQQRPAPALYQDERLLSFSSSSSPQAPEHLRLLPRQSGKGAGDASSSSSSTTSSSSAESSTSQRDPNAGFNTPGSIGRAGTVVDLVICLLSTIGSVTIIVPFLRNKRGRKLRHALIFGLGLSDLGSSLIVVITSSFVLSGESLASAQGFCDFAGYILAVTIFCQHLWAMAIGIVTYMLLVHPLSRFTLGVERWLHLIGIAFGIIAAVIYIGPWIVFGWSDAGGYCSLRAVQGNLTAPLLQFVPRALVFVLLIVLYAKLFFFLRRTSFFSKVSSRNGPGSAVANAAAAGGAIGRFANFKRGSRGVSAQHETESARRSALRSAVGMDDAIGRGTGTGTGTGAGQVESLATAQLSRRSVGLRSSGPGETLHSEHLVGSKHAQPSEADSHSPKRPNSSLADTVEDEADTFEEEKGSIPLSPIAPSSEASGSSSDGKGTLGSDGQAQRRAAAAAAAAGEVDPLDSSAPAQPVSSWRRASAAPALPTLSHSAPAFRNVFQQPNDTTSPSPLGPRAPETPRRGSEAQKDLELEDDDEDELGPDDSPLPHPDLFASFRPMKPRKDAKDFAMSSPPQEHLHHLIYERRGSAPVGSVSSHGPGLGSGPTGSILTNGNGRSSNMAAPPINADYGGSRNGSSRASTTHPRETGGSMAQRSNMMGLANFLAESNGPPTGGSTQPLYSGHGGEQVTILDDPEAGLGGDDFAWGQNVTAGARNGGKSRRGSAAANAYGATSDGSTSSSQHEPVESLGTTLNRQASVLMLLYPVAYCLLFSVSIIRIITDLANRGNPNPASVSRDALHSISRWFIFAQGAFDALIFQFIERQFRLRMKRRRRKALGEAVPDTLSQRAVGRVKKMLAASSSRRKSQQARGGGGGGGEEGERAAEEDEMLFRRSPQQELDAQLLNLEQKNAQQRHQQQEQYQLNSIALDMPPPLPEKSP